MHYWQLKSENMQPIWKFMIAFLWWHRLPTVNHKLTCVIGTINVSKINVSDERMSLKCLRCFWYSKWNILIKLLENYIQWFIWIWVSNLKKRL